MDGISYAYIDKGLDKSDEKNRDKAIKEMLRKYLYFYPEEEPTEDEKREAAKIVIAIATERIQSLVPPTVKWSGQGIVYSAYGEDIETKDNYFPFGTKLYRRWIEKFSDIYNDLWAITNSRKNFLNNFLKGYENNPRGIDKDFMNEWLDEINSRIKEIHLIHAKLLTQIQIIDTQIDLPRFGKDLGILIFYGLLLLFSGFFAPKLIDIIKPISDMNIMSLAVATTLSYVLIGIRTISAVQPKEKNTQKTIFMQRLSIELDNMKTQCMRYKPHYINHILSLDYDLKLNNKLRRTLSAIAEKVEVFNECASVLYRETEKIIEPIKIEFSTSKKSQHGFGIKILELANEGYDIEGIKSRILKEEENNFCFTYEEIDSSCNIFTINLSELDRQKRLKLCKKLECLRRSIQSLPSYKSTIAALNDLQKDREIALSQVEKSYNRVKTGV